MQARDGGEAIPPVVARIFSGDSTSPLTREARIWCEAKALLLYQNDNERIYHTKKYINYAESGINRNPFLPPLEKGEVARLVKVSLLSIQSLENLSLISLKQIRAVTVGIVFP